MLENPPVLDRRALRAADAKPVFTQRRAVTSDERRGEIRTHDLAQPDRPYHPFTYDPAAEDAQ